MNRSESQRVEFKESWRDDYMKTISAFANTSGGKLFVGIKDDRSICGIEKAEKIQEDLPNKFINILGVHANFHIHQENEKQYLEISVEKSPYPVSYHGRFYTRNGSTTQELKGNALQNLLLTANNITWDEITIPNASWDEINLGTVRLFTRKAIQENRLPADVNENNIQELFANLGLSKDGVLTRAAMLLFAKNPTRYCFMSVCKVGRFQGSGYIHSNHANLITDDVIECPLFQMPDRIMELLLAKYLQRNFSYKGLQRIETLEYPEIGLREAILNAIIHRDYGENSFFTIKVFDDILELWNPGELMEPLSIDALKQQHPSRLRNKLMANVFYRSGQIETWGRGTLKIVSNALEGNYPEPEFEYLIGGVLVRFGKKKFVAEGAIDKANVVNSPKRTENEKKTLVLIRDNSRITAEEIALQLHVTKRSVERILLKLTEEKAINRQGARKDGEWITTDEALNFIEDPIRTENETKILESIRKNSRITADEIALEFNITKRSVERILSKLTDEKIITRQGARKDGEWIIMSV